MKFFNQKYLSLYEKFIWTVLFLIILLNIISVFLATNIIGISWDEPTHVLRLKAFFKFGWYIPETELDQGTIREDSILRAYVYGPIAALFAHGVAILLRAEHYGVLSFTKEAYSARHLSIAFFSLITLLSISGITKLILGKWRWGFVSAALLSSLPLWSGHSMFNIKDIPVACGYTVSLFGLLLIYKHCLKKNNLEIFIALLIAVAGITLLVGTRPGMWTFIVASIVIGQVILLFSSHLKGNIKSTIEIGIKTIFWISLTLVISYSLLLIIYPNAFSKPVSLFIHSSLGSARFGWPGGFLTNGVFHGTPPPAWYLPTWLFYQTPVAILILWIIGLLTSLITAIKFFIINNSDIASRIKNIGLVLTIFQALFAPFMVIIFKTTIYDATRQLMFIFPALSVLGAVGLFYTFQLLKKYAWNVLGKFCFLALIFKAFISPTVDQWILYPYNYVYLNEIATLNPISERWPTDYWLISNRALIEKSNHNILIDCNGLPPQPKGYVVPLQRPNKWKRSYPSNLNKGCGNLVGDPYIQQHLFNNASKPKDRFYLIGTNRWGIQIPENCELIQKEKRSLRGQEFILGWLSLCYVKE